ncbi:MAG: hypothetical protein WDO06_00180 [Actinomycetota bacterium]
MDRQRTTSGSTKSEARGLNLLNLTQGTVDRSSHLRSNNEKLEELWKQAKILVLIDGQFLASDTALKLLSSKEIEKEFGGVGERYFLGIDPASELSYFVWNVHKDLTRTDSFQEEEFRTLRQVGFQFKQCGSRVGSACLGSLQLARIASTMFALWRCYKCCAGWSNASVRR